MTASPQEQCKAPCCKKRGKQKTYMCYTCGVHTGEIKKLQHWNIRHSSIHICFVCIGNLETCLLALDKK